MVHPSLSALLPLPLYLVLQLHIELIGYLLPLLIRIRLD